MIDEIIIEEHKVPLLNVKLQVTMAIWWGFHRNYLVERQKIKVSMGERFLQESDYVQ